MPLQPSPLSIPQHWLFHLRKCRGFIPALLISCCTVPRHLKPGFDWVTPLLRNLEWPLVAFFKVFSNPGLLFKAPITCLSYLCSFLITLLPVPEIMPPSPGPRLSPGTSFCQASFPLADLPRPTLPSLAHILRSKPTDLSRHSLDTQVFLVPPAWDSLSLLLAPMTLALYLTISWEIDGPELLCCCVKSTCFRAPNHVTSLSLSFPVCEMCVTCLARWLWWSARTHGTRWGISKWQLSLLRTN